jgi:hypothetical protein
MSNLTSSFPICVFFIPISSITDLARNSSTVLKKSGHLCFVSDLEKMVSDFPHLV